MGIARALAAEGCAVMLNGFGEREEIERQRAELAEAFDVKVLYSGGNLEQAGECADLIADAEARLGPVDILVNNAGIQHVAPVESFPIDRWDSILAVNLTAGDQYCFNPWIGGFPKKSGLCCSEAWAAWADQGGCAGDGRRGHHV